MVGGTMVAVLAGCKSAPKVAPEKADMLSLLMPRQIRIQPFTKIKSFDADQVPDGILLVLRPTDEFGDPIKIVGHLYFELYAYKKASAERKGERIEFWERTLATAQDQKLYWDRTAQIGRALRPLRITSTSSPPRTARRPTRHSRTNTCWSSHSASRS